MSRESTSFGLSLSSDVVDDEFEVGGLDPLYYISNHSLKNSTIEALENHKEDGNYRLIELNEVASRRKKSISQYEDEEVAYEVMVENIDRLTGEFKGLEETTVEEITSNYPTCEPGDILYLRLRPYRRKVTVVPERAEIGMKELDFDSVPVACSGEMCVLKEPDGGTITSYSGDSIQWDPEYLHLILQSDLVLFQLLPATKGGTRPRVPFDEIMKVKIPYPPQEVRNEMVQEMKEFQDLLQELKKKYHQMLGPRLFEDLGISDLEGTDTSLITDGMNPDLVSLLIEADLLPESYSDDPFDQLS